MLTTVFELPQMHQRHLWWSLYGPALLDCSWSPAQFSWLDPEPTQFPIWLQRLEAPEPTRLRLGFRFEQVWQQFFKLQNIPHLANIAIRDETLTLGELDLLLANQHQQCHVEIALKFYLGTPTNWFGPDSRDFLANKIQHLKNHQLPLREHPATVQTLHALGWQPTHSEALVRGCLFYPAHLKTFAALPPEVNPKHWSGRWCYANDMDTYLPEGLWTIMPKSLWMSPAVVDSAATKHDIIAWAESECERTQTPVCIAHVRPHQHQFFEEERWFIAPASWPERRQEN